MTRFRPCAALVLAGLIAATGLGQPPPSGANKSVEKKSAPKAPTLDEIIAAAVRGNPDVAIAEAEVQLAQAKLNAVRAAAAQKVSAIKDAVDDAMLRARQAESMFDQARQLVALSEAQAARVAELHARGQAPANEADKFKAEVIAQRAKAQAAEKDIEQARLQYARLRQEWERLAERVTRAQGAAEGEGGGTSEALVRQRAVAWLRAANREPATAPGSPAEQLRKALDKPVKLEAGRIHVVEAIAKALAAASLNVRVKAPAEFDPKVNKAAPSIPLAAGELPLGSWLQLFTDELADPPGVGTRFEFYVRDYGLLLTTPGTAPPGAMPLAVFWKQPLAPTPPPAAKP